jgi:hypothetical protein
MALLAPQTGCCVIPRRGSRVQTSRFVDPKKRKSSTAADSQLSQKHLLTERHNLIFHRIGSLHEGSR